MRILSTAIFSTLFLLSCADTLSDTENTETQTNTENSDTQTNTQTDTENTDAQTNTSSDTDTQTTTETDDQTSTSTQRPNILLIIADDQGVDASAQYSYSSDIPNTPNINALAESGIVFDNAWATPACTTTRGTLISGMHGVNSGVDTVPDTLIPSVATIQSLINTGDDAYATAVIGKWHIAGNGSNLNHPDESGVGYYKGTIKGTLTDYNNWTVTHNGEQTTSTTYHTTAITDYAIDWIDEQSQPWFMWLAYVAPHSPFHLPPSNLHDRNLSGEDTDISDNTRDYYLAAIEAMDTEIGRLIDSLPAQVQDNTLIIYIGDNGTPASVIDTSVYDRNKSKNSLYEGGIRVPMLASGAGVTRINEREDALVNSVDIFATIFEASQTTNSLPDIDGQSFYELLSDANASSRSFNYSEFISNNVTGWVVRDADYKLIEFSDGEQELYYLPDDLNETNNLLLTDDYQFNVDQLSDFADSVRE